MNIRRALLVHITLSAKFGQRGYTRKAKYLTLQNPVASFEDQKYLSNFIFFVSMEQFITFGFACTPLYFVWEKVVGVHDTKSLCLRAVARLPVVIPIWFLAIIFPFFGPINSTVGAFLVSFTVYIIPTMAHMLTFRSAQARKVLFWTHLYFALFCFINKLYIVLFRFGLITC